MKKKKLALLMAAALAFTSMDGTVFAVHASDLAVAEVEETTDEAEEIPVSDEQQTEGSDVAVEEENSGEELEEVTPLTDSDVLQEPNPFSDGSDEAGVSDTYEVKADEYVTVEEGTKNLSITENTCNEFGDYDFCCEFTPKEDGYYIFSIAGDDIISYLSLRDEGKIPVYNGSKPYRIGSRLQKGKTYEYDLTVIETGDISVSVTKGQEKAIKDVKLVGKNGVDTTSFQLFQELKELFDIEVTYADNSVETYAFDKNVNDTSRNWNITDAYGTVINVSWMSIESQIKDAYITYKIKFSYRDINTKDTVYTDLQSISCKSLQSLTQIQQGKVYNIPVLNGKQLPGKNQGFCFIPETSGYYIYEKNGTSSENYFSIDKINIEGGPFGGKDIIVIKNIGGDEGKGQNKGRIYLEAGEVYLVRGRNDSGDQVATIPFLIRDENKICEWKEISRTAPTCTKEGEIIEKCQNHPQEALKKTKIPALGHKYSTWTVAKKPTTVEKGIRERNCTVCANARQTETIAKLNATARLNVQTGTLPLKIKQSFTIKVSNLGEGDSIESWKSSNSKVAVVKNGKITAKKAGNAQITVKLKSGLSKTVKIKVQKSNVVTKSLKVSDKTTGRKIASKVTLKRKQTLKLSAEISPVTSRQKVTYSTSNKKIATVNSKGVVTAKKKGKATITVKSGNKTVKIKVTVK